MESHFYRELQVARAAAVRAGENALRIQARGVAAETKADLSPVTIADKENERMIAALIDEHFPEDGVLGEEGSAEPSRSGRRWIIDPIDGTRDFVRGLPLWCVLIGLEEEATGEIKVGVAHFPVLRRTYFAARGAGAFLNDTPMRASSITSVDQAVLMLNAGNKVLPRPDAARWLEFMSQFWSFRCLGGPWDAMLVASGHADVWIEPSAHAWDFAPMQVIAEEAGARFLNLEGTRSIHEGSGIVCAPGMERAVRSLLSPTKI